MKKIDYRILIIDILILFDLFFVNLIGYKYFGNITNNIINPLIWLLVLVLSIYFFKNEKQRISGKTNKEQKIFIVVLIYLMLYFVQGLFFGYSKSPYNRNIYGLLLNIWSYVLIIIYQEYVRNINVRNGSKIITVIIFVLIDINLYSFFNIKDFITLFKQISSVIIPSIATNMLLVYLTSKCGFIACLLYKIPLVLSTYLLPIFPDLDWFFISVEQTLLPFITYLTIKNVEDKKLNVRRKQLKKKNKTSILLVFILLIVIAFVAGLFKYKPISIMSNSMYPVIKRGDIAVIEEKSIEELNNLKKYDIISYRLDNIVVVHRIIAIEKHNNQILYITKGDNNNMADKEKVKPNQINGVVQIKIPALGYPSVWLNEFFNKKQTLVETGK